MTTEAELAATASRLAEKLNRMMFKVAIDELLASRVTGTRFAQQVRRFETTWQQKLEDHYDIRPTHSIWRSGR